MSAFVSRLALLIVLALAFGVATSCGVTRSRALAANDRPQSTADGARLSAGKSPFRFFSSTSFWNRPLPAHVRLDRRSAAIVGAFDAEITKEEEAKTGSVNILTTSWSVLIYTVPADQPTVKVAYAGGGKSPALQSAWDAVPLPANAQPAAGTDKHLVVWQPSTDRLWEFWHLEQTSQRLAGSVGWRDAERVDRPRCLWSGKPGLVRSRLGRHGVFAVDRWVG